MVKSDPKLLRRIIQGSLTNAFRYTSQGREFVFRRQARRGTSPELKFGTTGLGSNRRSMQETFEEFNPGGHIRSRSRTGFGTCHLERIAQVLGHQISMRSWPGQGSMFPLTLQGRPRVMWCFEARAIGRRNRVNRNSGAVCRQ
ncbi:ATP-binding protein [Vibrio sp. PP-XX7]